MTRTALYRHYNADGALLYVGISNSPIYRLRQHEASAWFFNISNVSIEWHATERAARAAERKAIAVERPLHNRAHNPTGDVGAFIGAVGREEFSRRLRIGQSRISNVIAMGKMPCRWARIVARMCREQNLYVPIDAFPFKGVETNRDCITTLFDSDDAECGAA